ncbi:MAG: phosphodiester glycosidase family protein [Candidatus Bipolaricaulota bacterium]
MDSGTTRAIVLAVFAIAVASAALLSVGGPTVFLNGEKLEGLEVISTPRGHSVPLKEASRLFGADVKSDQKGGFLVEGGKTDSSYISASELTKSGNRYFVDLRTLIQNLGGEVGGDDKRISVELPPSKLVSASARPGEISLRFEKYASFSRTTRGSNGVEFKFFNVEKGNLHEVIELPKDYSYVKAARLLDRGDGQLILHLEYREGMSPTVKTTRGDSGFHFNLKLKPPEKDGDLPAPLKPERGEFSYNQTQLWVAGSSHTIHYLEVSEWRENYRLLPVIAEGEVGKGAKLPEMVQDSFGVAGINANFFDTSSYTPIGLLIKDGKLLSQDWGNRAAVGIDYFGRLKFFRPKVDLFLSTPVEKITIQGLNRPPGDDDLVAYTAEYGKKLTVKGSSVFLTLEDGKVLSRSSRPPVSIEAEQTVVIATGDKLKEIQGINRGDVAKYEWRMEPFVPLLTGAVSAGPLLVENGEDVLDLDEENFTKESNLVRSRANRSVLATTVDGNLLFIVVSDGGIGLEDLPSLLLKSGLNIENAIAFDGGSSAGVIYRDGVNYRSVGGSRRIPVGLVLVSKSQ